MHRLSCNASQVHNSNYSNKQQKRLPTCCLLVGWIAPAVTTLHHAQKWQPLLQVRCIQLPVCTCKCVIVFSCCRRSSGWGGQGLGEMKVYKSKLQKDKDAWAKAVSTALFVFCSNGCTICIVTSSHMKCRHVSHLNDLAFTAVRCLQLGFFY